VASNTGFQNRLFGCTLVGLVSTVASEGDMTDGALVEKLYDRFRSLLDAEDKYGCVRLALDSLGSGEIDIVSLYEDVLRRAAREEFCTLKQRNLCIWEEHVRTSIVRTVLECCFPIIMEARGRKHGDSPKGKVLVVCPTEEYHELGARMAADFFTLCGFDVTFVGANTPQEQIVEAVGDIDPAYVGVSVTNPYNLIAVRRTVQHLREVRDRVGASFKIVLGGDAIANRPDMVRQLGGEALVEDYQDICQLIGDET
jgi:methanogenic corrinoid protein MtbC1